MNKRLKEIIDYLEGLAVLKKKIAKQEHDYWHKTYLQGSVEGFQNAIKIIKRELEG